MESVSSTSRKQAGPSASPPSKQSPTVGSSVAGPHLVGLMLLLTVMRQVPKTAGGFLGFAGTSSMDKTIMEDQEQVPEFPEEHGEERGQFRYTPLVAEGRFYTAGKLSTAASDASDEVDDKVAGESGTGESERRARRRRRRRQAALTKSASPSSSVDSAEESSDVEDSDLESSSVAAASSSAQDDYLTTSPSSQAWGASVIIDNITLSFVAQFLPLDSLLAMRLVCTNWYSESQARLSFNPIPAACRAPLAANCCFLRLPRRVTESLPIAKEFQQWRCGACKHLNRGTHTPCAGCRSPFDAAAIRLFVGQLNKDLGAAYVRFIMGNLVPSVKILHVEAHTSRNEQRGRGAAFVHLDSEADANLVCERLGKSVFIDTCSHTTDEGIWICKEKMVLQAWAEQRGIAYGRPLQLPRQPLVVERRGQQPAGLMSKSSVASTPRSHHTAAVAAPRSLHGAGPTGMTHRYGGGYPWAPQCPAAAALLPPASLASEYPVSACPSSFSSSSVQTAAAVADAAVFVPHVIQHNPYDWHWTHARICHW